MRSLQLETSLMNSQKLTSWLTVHSIVPVVDSIASTEPGHQGAPTGEPTEYVLASRVLRHLP